MTYPARSDWHGFRLGPFAISGDSHLRKEWKEGWVVRRAWWWRTTRMLFYFKVFHWMEKTWLENK